MFAVLAVALAATSACQWQAAVLPFRMFGLANIHEDEAADALYFCGDGSLDNDFVLNDNAVPVWVNGQWDTLSVFNGHVASVVRWNDTLFAAGSYMAWNNDLTVRRCAFQVGNTWVPAGDFDEGIYRLRVVNNELYALGVFNVVDGMPCKGIAKRVGGHWESVGVLNTAAQPYIQDLVEWNGTLYITGLIGFSAQGPNHIAYLSSSGDWLPLGPGIQGGFGFGRSLAVYNDELYVGGSIQLSAGNAGNGIMRWDGLQFLPVGTGFQGWDGTTNTNAGAVELETHDNNLWACGTFNYAGNVPCPGIAFWDGMRWCGLPPGPELEINTIEFFHDTLFASCHINLNGVPVNCAVRFTGSIYSDTCSVAVGIEASPSMPRSTLRAWRRGGGHIEILGVPPGHFEIALNDGAGRRLQSGTIAVQSGGSAAWEVGPLPGAYYLIEIKGVGSVRFLGP